MAIYNFRDASIFYGDTDISAFANQVQIDLAADSLDSTTFGQTFRTRVGGLVDGTVTASGFLDNATGDPDDHLFSQLATQGVLSVAPVATVSGGIAYMMRVREFMYRPGGNVSELHGFAIDAKVSDGIGAVRGTIGLHKTARTVTGNGTAYQVGAVSATQKMHAALHVFAGTASTLDVKVRSDNVEAMSSPVDQITFTQASGATSEYGSVSGAITDDWWQVSYTIGGGTWTFAVILGIR